MSAGRLSNYIKHRFLCLFDLVVEICALLVADEDPLLMAHVCVPQALILLPRLIQVLIPRLSIDFCLIKRLCAKSSCGQVDDCIVPIVSDLHSGHTQVVHQGLPLAAGYVC